jgi:hypothetical protein
LPRRKLPNLKLDLQIPVTSSADGHVITNHHVMDGAEDIRAEYAEGKTYKAKLVGSDPRASLAVEDRGVRTACSGTRRFCLQPRISSRRIPAISDAHPILENDSPLTGHWAWDPTCEVCEFSHSAIEAAKSVPARSSCCRYAESSEHMYTARCWGRLPRYGTDRGRAAARPCSLR